MTYSDIRIGNLLSLITSYNIYIYIYIYIDSDKIVCTLAYRNTTSLVIKICSPEIQNPEV